ncbi:FtsX-like permease family protein [Taibaiella lutea]|uniref:FtsX-like permease family protein n=1 Tax=Taibaiella lutea TaxID=2608001 RepID=A0A5M6CB37_9BACT|nr:FtsX-like permease family protein [Taibaiella lutea]KAA5532354.1 FtsX-like permease family protein [Taibaiella lutea]
MNPAFKIAWRYFRGKKSAQAINIISWISIVAIAVSSAAMVILFSVFNGLEGTVKDMYAAFYPEIKVSSVKGKFFQVSDAQKNEISKISGIRHAAYSIEDMVLFEGNKEQKVGTLKGVDDAWFDVCGLDTFMIDGKATWENSGGYTPSLIGLGVEAALGIDINNAFSGVKVFYPKAGASITENPEEVMNNIVVKPKGTFKIQVEFDDQYVLVPLNAAQYLFNKVNQISSVEIKLNSQKDEDAVKEGLEKIFGSKVNIENRFEQNKTFFMIMHGEKWAVYVILLMVLLIAAFNMIGSLSMVVLEKKNDIVILRSMGADKNMIRAVFLYEGILQAIVGGIIGIVFGSLVCLSQMYFGWFPLPEGFIIDSYPVSLQITDIMLVLANTAVVGFLAAWYPSLKAARQAVFVRED